MRGGARPAPGAADAPCMIRVTAMRRIAALLVIALGLAACGTKGALYLPPPENPDAAAATKKK